LTFDFDLDMIKKNRRAKYLGQRSCSSSHCPDTQTDTHTGPISLPGPLKWSVIWQ